jgi:hypothetical protein
MSADTSKKIDPRSKLTVADGDALTLGIIDAVKQSFTLRRDFEALQKRVAELEARSESQRSATRDEPA